jgi:hypothetical protein
MMDWVPILLSSAVISGIVSALISNGYQERQYIRDKKLTVYSEFLDQLDKAVPLEHIFGESTHKKMLAEMQIHTAKLKKFIRQIRLISTDKNIVNLCEKLLDNSWDIANLIDEVGEKGSSKKTEAEAQKELAAMIDKKDALGDKIATLMNKDLLNRNGRGITSSN